MSLHPPSPPPLETLGYKPVLQEPEAQHNFGRPCCLSLPSLGLWTRWPQGCREGVGCRVYSLPFTPTNPTPLSATLRLGSFFLSSELQFLFAFPRSAHVATAPRRPSCIHLGVYDLSLTIGTRDLLPLTSLACRYLCILFRNILSTDLSTLRINGAEFGPER